MASISRGLYNRTILGQQQSEVQLQLQVLASGSKGRTMLFFHRCLFMQYHCETGGPLSSQCAFLLQQRNPEYLIGWDHTIQLGN